MFFRDSETIDRAFKQHIADIKEMERLRAEIVMLRSQPNLVKEAIDRFCHPSMYASAMQWLERIGL